MTPELQVADTWSILQDLRQAAGAELQILPLPSSPNQTIHLDVSSSAQQFVSAAKIRKGRQRTVVSVFYTNLFKKVGGAMPKKPQINLSQIFGSKKDSMIFHFLLKIFLLFAIPDSTMIHPPPCFTKEDGALRVPLGQTSKHTWPGCDIKDCFWSSLKGFSTLC